MLREPTEEWGYDDDPVPSAVRWVSKTKFNSQLTSHKSRVHVLVALHVSHELREMRNIILSGEFTVFAVNRLANCQQNWSVISVIITLLPPKNLLYMAKLVCQGPGWYALKNLYCDVCAKAWPF